MPAISLRTDGDIVAVYFAIVVCCFLHNLAFFHLTRLSASATAWGRPFSELYCIVRLIALAAFQAVMAGINKAVQAVSVFAVSHKFYCDIDAQQCLTAGKVTAMAMVVAGVLLFSFGKKWCACPPRRTETNLTPIAGDRGQATSSPPQSSELQSHDDSIDPADGFRISDTESYGRLSASANDWTAAATRSPAPGASALDRCCAPERAPLTPVSEGGEESPLGGGGAGGGLGGGGAPVLQSENSKEQPLTAAPSGTL